jgi:hypothetical protein
MGNFTPQENKILNALIADTVNYGLSEKEALAYIKARLGGKEISVNVYYKRKKKVDSGEHSQQWFSYYTRVGFMISHKNIIDTIGMIQKDTIRDYLILQNREIKDPVEIRQLRYDIRENCKLLQELSLGTPIIAQLKAKIDHVEMLQPSK